MLGLGLSPDDREQMREVSVIFHVAASVRFDDPLQAAILLNTRGTREVVHFAEQLPNLRVLMHVSSTYSNPDRYVIDEEVSSGRHPCPIKHKAKEQEHARMV